ncbi:MAG: hypothetical protein Homavirus46_2 [Homavirus sp.]|uniref:Uncharacterized protein n=1 Tax=Homavirus sp. TaxID=2487769 RepID=A0A3G5A5V4_9VIRU|nr:MAG: hypothetical protein Homavirus46_2 [Homavirus sp.]
MGKKYYVVVDESTQDGGFIPIKIVQFSPLVYGPPIIRFTPACMSNRAIRISVVSEKISFDIYVPYRMLRELSNDIYMYRNMDNIGPVKFTLTTPTFSHTMRTNYRSLLKIIKTIKDNYNTYPLFEDQSGNSIQIGILLGRINNLLNNIIEK